MKRTQFELIEKNNLTNDVFELKFKADDFEQSQAWQFVTFTLKIWEKKLKRAYSIAYQEDDILTFIIKRLEEWKGWSKAICDIEIGEKIDWMFPLWIFILSEEPKTKLFIGTGTGFAPLYFQIKKALEIWINEKMHFIFGVRHLEDVFYKAQLDYLAYHHSNFTYEIYLSREEKKSYTKGYVTDYLVKENVESFDEFYICWSPAMVTDASSKLEFLWKKDIFSEEY